MTAFVAMCKKLWLLIKQELHYNPNNDLDEVYYLSKALYLWSKIVPFLLVTIVENKEDGNFVYKDKVSFDISTNFVDGNEEVENIQLSKKI